MAYNKLTFENPRTGKIKTAPVGFSWTVALFGFFPPLFRGDWKWAFLQLVACLLTAGFSVLYFMFAYNKLYIKELIGAGYQVRNVQAGSVDAIAAQLGINLPELERH